MKMRTKLETLSALPGRELEDNELLLVVGGDCRAGHGTGPGLSDCRTVTPTNSNGVNDTHDDYLRDALGGGGTNLT